MKKSMILIALVSMISIACQKAGAPPEKTFPVKTEPVARGYIASTVTVMGSVDSKVHSWVQSTIEGTVQSLTVREGNHVREGQVLCYIMPPDSLNMLGQARLEYERTKRETSDDNSDDARARLSEAEKEFAIAKTLFRPMPMVSPAKGTVISKTIENGSTVASKQPLIEIADLSNLIIKTAVSEDLVSRLRRGQKARVTLYADAEKTFDGTISIINPGVNFQTRTAGVEIVVGQRSSNMKPGMTVSVEFVTEARNGALTVPLEAILTDASGNKRIFSVKDGKAAIARVSTGIESNNRVEIVSGLQAGDQIVVLGHENLKNGVKVSTGAEKKNDKVLGPKK
ncbi:MAG: efflux RND transporter periplasmic adaptor subunit [Spirochaetota bacterium]